MICMPLGLYATYSPIDNYEVYSKLATPYDLVGGKYKKSPFIDYSLGRRIFSTSGDLYKWGLEMLNPTQISKESHQTILTNHLRDINAQISYGYGWVIFDGQGDYRMGNVDLKGNYFIHGGATDGYRSILIVYNEGQYIISLLGNIGDQIDELATIERILKILTLER